MVTWSPMRHLKKEWIKTHETKKRLQRIAQWIDNFGGLIAIQRHLEDVFSTAPSLQSWIIRENGKIYGDYDAKISF